MAQQPKPPYGFFVFMGVLIGMCFGWSSACLTGMVGSSEASRRRRVEVLRESCQRHNDIWEEHVREEDSLCRDR